MLNAPRVRLGVDPPVNRALHEPARSLVWEARLLRHLALRGVAVALLLGAFAASPGAGLLYADPVPGATAIGGALAVAGAFLVVFTTVRYQAALAVAADAVLEGRTMSCRRAVAVAGARWKTLVAWSLAGLAPRHLRRRASRHSGRPRRSTRSVLGGTGDVPWPLTALLVLPVVTLERVGARTAMLRAEELAVARWGRGGTCRFRRAWPGFTAAAVGGTVLAALGATLALRGAVGPRAAWLAVTAAGLALVIAGLAARNASRMVLAVALFRYARDDVAAEPFDAGALQGALSSTSMLVHLLAASGCLRALDGSPVRPVTAR